MEAVSNLNIDNMPSQFLGISGDANLRRYATWIPVIETRRRDSPIGKVDTYQVGVGWYCLSSIPLFYLSFYKAPKKVRHELTQVQR
jgi:hypothetical protein